MGIRTKGFTKTSSQKLRDIGEESKGSSLAIKQEVEENNITDPGELTAEEKVVPKVETVVTRPQTRGRENFTRSPLKYRTSVAMARLGGMKVATRKLKKHRKRSLFVQSANKILRSSIKSNKTRRTAAKVEEKTRTNGSAVPSRVSTRTLVRRNSREGIPESPLRTVELIKRPLELREPATKLLYMASLGLYPRTGESDMTPIVVIRELNCSPGKKNGVRKSLELPLIPQYHKRYLNLESGNNDKQSFSENVKPGLGVKQVKRESRKGSPANSKSDDEGKKQPTGRKTPVSNSSPPLQVPEAPKPKSSVGESVKVNEQATKRKVPTPKSSGGNTNTISLPNILQRASTLDLTVTPTVHKLSSFAQETEKPSPNSSSKSLLKSNISPPLKQAKDNLSLPFALNLTSSFPAKTEIPKPTTTESFLASSCSVTQAMNLIMSNITILPTSSVTNSRKRFMNDTSELQMDDVSSSKNLSFHNTNFIGERQPPKKKQKTRNEILTKCSSVSPLPMSLSVSANNNSSIESLFLQAAQAQNMDDQALNLCTKKINSGPLNTPMMQQPPKLQMNSNVNIQKEKPNGSKALNLIIPRPPPLLKAPLDVTNFGNLSQNIHPVLPIKSKTQQKRTKKARSNNNNQLTLSNLPIQDSLALPMMPQLSSLPLLGKTDATLHAKSLLKCMNGEENTCAREIGESLDSVKTMLSRLQTRIGPAVNGVRLITIE